MSTCNLTSSITKAKCAYSLAGIKDVYLINQGEADWDKSEAGKITAPEMLGDAKAYKIAFIPNTASYTDELAENGNGGKYRTHTLNFSLETSSYAELNQGDALSLGRFTAIVVDQSGRAVVLGRCNGLNATAYNYESGAAEADATGWTVTMVSSEIEMAPLLPADFKIDTIADVTQVVP